jgi:hypothetical protein
MNATRYDRAELKATCTDEGYLIDSPVVGRVGIQIYKDASGAIRREYRPAEEVFSADSLATFAGKPITDDHPSEKVTASNAKALGIGVMQSEGYQDGNDVRTKIIIHDASAIDKATKGGKRELSLGYTVDLDETPGEFEGQPYDAVQRNIRVNHLALVKKGRAGNARLSLDRFDAVAFTEEGEHMSKVKLDNGIEYDAAPEVAIELQKLRSDATDSKTRADDLGKKIEALTAEADTLKAEVAKIPQIKADAEAAAVKAIAARADLEKQAADFKVDCSGKTDREVREACIKTLRADADLSGKSDEYIAAAFDTSLALRADAAIAAQRLAGTKQEKNDKAQATSHSDYMKSLGKQE